VFRSGTLSGVETAQPYPLQAEKRSMERMVEAVPDSDYPVSQKFLTHSWWEYRAAMDQVAHNVQVGVFGALGRGDRVALIAAWLYTPKEWTDGPHRCERADPRAEQAHRSPLQQQRRGWMTL
jgi:hypothetical protein